MPQNIRIAMSRLLLALPLLLTLIFNPALADDDDDERRSKPVINQVQITGSSIFVYGSELIKNRKDKVFFAAESSSEMMEVPFMEGGPDFLEVMLPYEPGAGTYRLGVGKSEKKQRISELITFGSIGADGRDGVDGVDGLDGSPGADGQDGQDGAKGDPGADGSSCSVTQTAAGATLSCTDGTMASVANGMNGANGRDGIDGINGVNGQNGADGQNGVDGSSCSASQDGSSVVITCADGTSGVLASAGTVVLIPEGGIVGTNEPILIPQGEIVWIDSNDTVLGLSFGQFIGLADGYLDAVVTDGPPAPAVSTNQSFALYYLDAECAGQAFIARTQSLHDIGNGNHLVADPESSPVDRVLFKGKIGTASFNGRYKAPWECQTGDFVVNRSKPAVTYQLPTLLQQAQFPVRIEQLP